MAAKAFGIVGEGDSYGNGGSCGGEDNLISSLHSSQAHAQVQGGSKMVRKRAASEMEFHSSARFSRRTTATGNGDYVACSSAVNVPLPPNPPIPSSTNYSTSMTMMLPMSSAANFNILMKQSTGSGSDSAAAASVSTNFMESASSSSSSSCQQNQILSSTGPSPSVCVFSGLPLFPPDRNRAGAGGLQLSPGPGMKDTTAWIDGIIRDLIHTSNHVSIPHLILNVREIIHPCNPNLAALLEHRLRSLTPPDNDDRIRRKEPLHPPPPGLRLHLPPPPPPENNNSSSSSNLLLSSQGQGYTGGEQPPLSEWVNIPSTTAVGGRQQRWCEEGSSSGDLQ